MWRRAPPERVVRDVVEYGRSVHGGFHFVALCTGGMAVRVQKAAAINRADALTHSQKQPRVHVSALCID
jgi:hypothetical protein